MLTGIVPQRPLVCRCGISRQHCRASIPASAPETSSCMSHYGRSFAGASYCSCLPDKLYSLLLHTHRVCWHTNAIAAAKD